MQVNIKPNKDVKELSFTIGNHTMRAVWLEQNDTAEHSRRKREASVDTTVLLPGDPWVCTIPHEVTESNPGAAVEVNVTGVKQTLQKSLNI